ncbi:aspartate/glutamate racemase family protein [Aureimonas sp. ME7]|uniref:aspartate/glutamate racemase family protein n=1 Tax=Aureimonas sp. ME7 TaxID=2744252 RepID=UPI0015F4D581|nr:aspartate/glutamate racemase family protein [Aureimonas sp. ME7]
MTRIALINANTTRAMTERMVDAARRLAPAGVAIEGHTAPEGAPYISTPEAAARAGEVVRGMAEAFATAGPPDAVMIACFGDPGLFEARALLPVPVLGMADASCHVAAQLGARFAIVTGGHAWGPMLEAFVDRIGLGSRLAGVRTIELTGDRIAADPAGAETLVLGEIERARDNGADVVILGGAGLVGFADRLTPRSPAILLDSLACLVAQTCALTGFGLRTRPQRSISAAISP